MMEAQLNHYQPKLAFETDSWDLMVALEAQENVVVIDTRSPEAFVAGNMPGAITIPHRQMTNETTASIYEKPSFHWRAPQSGRGSES
jgi:rhodanese-related sulfurtransferase